MDSLDVHKEWDTTMVVKKGDKVYGGTIIAEVPETPAIIHKVMVPPGMDGYLVSVAADGKYTINDTLAVLQKADGTEVNLTMVQKCPSGGPALQREGFRFPSR